MHATEFLRKVPAEVPSVVALVGEERSLKSSVTDALLKAASPGEDDSPTKFAGKDVDMKSVRDELLTVSMWGDRRIVIVEDASDFVTANRAALEKYCEKPAKKGLLVLDIKSMPKNTRLFKIVDASGLIIECSELKGAALNLWVKDTLKTEYQKTMAPDAVALLQQLAGTGLSQLEQELSKLASYVGEQSSIDAEAVRRLVGGWKAETTWAMTDSVRDGRVAEALTALDKLLVSGESPYRILGGISFVFRKYSLATELSRQGVQLKVAIGKAGIHPREVDQASGYLRRMGRPKAEQIANWLLNADTSLKGGSRLSDRGVLELLLLQLSGAVELETVC
jgi:DNA polymerase III subunit delta